MTIFQGFVQEQGSQAHYDNGMLGTLNRNDYMIGELFEEVPILKKIAKGTSYGLVCGGYIRDIDTGRNPRDVDVVIHSARALSVIRALLEDGWLINSALQEAIVNGTADVGREYMDINGFLEFVMKARKGEVELDILVVTVDPDAYVKMIPISTSNCYAYYREYTFRDDELVVRRSSGYIDSLATKQVTISDSRINEAYLAKISSYYPDWLVIVEDDEQADTPDTRRAVELQTMY